MKAQLFLFISCSLLLGCNHDENSTTKPVTGCDGGLTANISFNDTDGDAAYSFIDMSQLSVTQTDQQISVAITLLDIPSEFAFNEVNVPDYYLEYSWGAIFDVDCDGEYANDIRLSITNFVFPEEPELLGPLLPNTQHNIWQVDSMGQGASNVGVISASIDGSQLILTANRDDYSGLANINSKTPVRFATYFYSAGTVYTDDFPNSADSYTSTN